jgi:hypothetical protein
VQASEPSDAAAASATAMDPDLSDTPAVSPCPSWLRNSFARDDAASR